jgi:hypothetical protein
MHGEDVIEAIGVINLYALAVDTRRWELFDRVFTPDVEADFGPQARWSDLASLKRDFAPAHEGFVATQHITTNHQVLVDGDAANAISYVHARFIRRTPEGGTLTESYGWYDDRLTRTVAGWRINRRVCRGIFASDHPLPKHTRFGTPVEEAYALSSEAASGHIMFLDKIENR